MIPYMETIIYAITWWLFFIILYLQSKQVDTLISFIWEQDKFISRIMVWVRNQIDREKNLTSKIKYYEKSFFGGRQMEVCSCWGIKEIDSKKARVRKKPSIKVITNE